MLSLMRRANQTPRRNQDQNFTIQKQRRRIEREIDKLERRHHQAAKAYTTTGKHAAAFEFSAARFVASSAGFVCAAATLHACLKVSEGNEAKRRDLIALAGAEMRYKLEKQAERLDTLKIQLERLQ